MPEQPNILVLFADQLRRHALSCYGDPNLETPNIDALAARGTRFSQACSTYPICVPFRFSLMTGQYAHSRMVPGIEWRMSPAERTLADEFNGAGYESIYVGKWHLYGGHGRQALFSSAGNVCRTPVPREHQGRWQRWFGFELRNGPYDTVYFVDDDPEPKVIEEYQTDGLFNLAMSAIKTRDPDKPFATIVSFEPPHPPYEPPVDLDAAWADRPLTLPENFDIPEEQREQAIQNLRKYYAMVENIDQNVGRMEAFLKEQGLFDNTVVVFISDHGELSGAHGLHNKQYPYEESVGVPLIIADPNGSPGQVVDDPTCTEDLFPTLLGLAGLNVPCHLPGLDLTACTRDVPYDLDRDGVYLEFVNEMRPQQPFYDGGWRGIRGTRYKYTARGDASGATPWQFFDLQQDPVEMNNLVASPDHQDLLAQYHGKLISRIKETGDRFPLQAAFGHEALQLVGD